MPAEPMEHAEHLIHARFRLARPDFILEADLSLDGHGITVIQGPSGSGKTTLLRCIAGLETPETGYLRINGRIWQDGTHTLPPYQRPIGYVFQEDSLFDHLTARKNMLFGCANHRDIPEALMPVIDTLGIGHLLEKKPAQLSGGERQRVAIARALAVEPDILLMDEPLSALDTPRRQEIIGLILKIHTLKKIPIIFVTHDTHEAEQLADERVFMDAGRVFYP